MPLVVPVAQDPSAGFFQMGRAGGSVLMGPPDYWTSRGGLVSVHGSALVTPNTDGVILRDQLLGYVGNGDEPVVPVILDGEPRLTGYYRVLDVDITTKQRLVSVGSFEYDLALEPVPGFAQPILESVMTGALLTNAVGAVTGDMQQFHAFPDAATEYFRGGVASSGATRVSADGTINFNTAGSINDTASFAVPPASFYEGAAMIEQGTPLRPVVGRLLAQPDPINWRLSNGLVRVTVDSAGQILVSHYSSGAWQTAKGYQLGVAALNPAVGTPTAMTILRNSVAECIVRLSMTPAGFFGNIGVIGRLYLDLALRRGDRLVRGYLSMDNAPGLGLQIKLTNSEAATAITTFGAVSTGGIRATSNDATGNRYVLLVYQAATTSTLGTGRLTQNSGSNKSLDFGIGCEVPGGAAAPHDSLSLAKQYLAAQSETQPVVSR